MYINGEVYFVHCSEDSILRCQFSSNHSADYKEHFQHNFNQKPRRLFCRNGPIHSKIHMKCKGPGIAIQPFGKKYKIGVLTWSDFKSLWSYSNIFKSVVLAQRGANR